MIWRSVGLDGKCDILDLTDFVLWDMAGDFGRWRGRTGDRGGMLSNSSSMSGVRERPSESLKLFSLGMLVVVVVTGEKIESSCSLLPLRQPRQQRPGVHQNLKGGVDPCVPTGFPHSLDFKVPQLRWLPTVQALYSYRP